MRQPVEVLPFGGTEPQRAGEGIEDLPRGPDVPSLLQKRVVGGRDVSQKCHLLPPQTGRPAPDSGRQAHVLGLEAIPPGAEEIGELFVIRPESSSSRQALR